MILIALNCRGLGRAAATLSLKATTKKHSPDLLFLSEVKTSNTLKIKRLITALGFQNFEFVPPIGSAGGLILAWKNPLKLQIHKASQNFINAHISPDPPVPPWQFTGVYGPTKYSQKGQFWNDMDLLAQNFNGASIFIGDFNSILSQADKTGGKPFVSSSSGGLQEVVDNNGLVDIGFSGPDHTWTNKRGGKAHIRERLDRGLANGMWHLMFPKASITHLVADTSDHAPLLLNTEMENRFRARPFRFEAMWSRDASCELVVQDAWACRRGNNAAYRLISALMCVQMELKVWNKKHFGHCQRLVDVLKERIYEIQKKPHSDELLLRENKLQAELQEVLLRLEVMWRQKSRELWLNEGDANTRYFHLSTVINRSYNSIIKIRNSVGEWITEPGAIGECFISFFKELFLTSNPSFPIDLNGLIQPTISVVQNLELCTMPTEMEVHDILWSMGGQKSPGPDGMPPIFYKTYWNTVKSEVIGSVKHFFFTKKMEKEINATFITLIKKTDSPELTSQFRPIALCNVSYKIIAKILANRLKSHLEGIIAVNQSAFIPGRAITDNSIVSQEIMHYIQKHRGKKGFMAIKIDMEKAYDRLEWNVLVQLLENHGFAPNFIEMVYQCLSSVSFSVLVNGSPNGKFNPTRGIRQGDPLSPYLFILYFDILSRLLNKAEMDGSLKGIKVCREAPYINHLMYADDLVVFCRATNQDASSVVNILDTFENWSGLKVNKSKSMVHFGKNVDNNLRMDIISTLGLEECDHRGKHLGLPFCSGRSKNADFQFIIEQVKNRLAGWRGKLLSQSSRGVLIQSVVQSIPAYSMQTFSIPVNICEKIDRMMRKFFWGVAEDKTHYLTLMAWDKITLPKSVGGLGFRKMIDQNMAFNAKLTWQMIEPDGRLWSRIFEHKYLKSKRILDINTRPPDSSWVWQAICKNIELVKSQTCFTIGDGSTTSIWEQEWIPTWPGFKPDRSESSSESKNG